MINEVKGSIIFKDNGDGVVGAGDSIELITPDGNMEVLKAGQDDKRIASILLLKKNFSGERINAGPFKVYCDNIEALNTALSKADQKMLDDAFRGAAKNACNAKLEHAIDPEAWADILEEGYTRLAEVHYKNAEEAANKGDATKMLKDLSEIRETWRDGAILYANVFPLFWSGHAGEHRIMGGGFIDKGRSDELRHKGFCNAGRNELWRMADYERLAIEATGFDCNGKPAKVKEE